VNIYTYKSVIKVCLVSAGRDLFGSIPQDLVLHDISRHTSHSNIINFQIKNLIINGYLEIEMSKNLKTLWIR
jgi:hypothetical protein